MVTASAYVYIPIVHVIAVCMSYCDELMVTASAYVYIPIVHVIAACMSYCDELMVAASAYVYIPIVHVIAVCMSYCDELMVVASAYVYIPIVHVIAACMSYCDELMVAASAYVYIPIVHVIAVCMSYCDELMVVASSSTDWKVTAAALLGSDRLSECEEDTHITREFNQLPTPTGNHDVRRGSRQQPDYHGRVQDLAAGSVWTQSQQIRHLRRGMTSYDIIVGMLLSPPES